MSRPAPERPGDVLPTADDFAGWPRHGALRAALRCGPVPIVLDRIDARAKAAVAELEADPMDADPDDAVRLEVTRASRGPWLELRPGDRLRSAAWQEAGGHATWVTHHAALLMDSELRRGIVVLTDQDAGETARSIQNVLRVACAWHLAARETGLLLHAAAIGVGSGSDGDEFVLLLGESGVGKSTAARLSAPRTVHADDVSVLSVDAPSGAVRLPANQFFAEPAIPGRATGSDRRRGAPVLASTFRLRQADRHSIEALRPSVAAASIVAHAPFLLDSMRPAALRVAERMAGCRPVAELRFARDAGFWTEIDHFLAGAERRRDTR